MTSTRKESLWLTCAEKRCCHDALVVPTGRDIWRISRALGTSPLTFLVGFETPVPRRDAFALDPSPRRFRLALARRPPSREGRPAPCVFLLRTRQGTHRCGILEERPRVCRTFPSELVAGVVTVQGAVCRCREWSLADVDVAEERAAVAARQADSEEYCGLVRTWNAQMAAAPRRPALTVADYLDYLLAAYDAAPPTAPVPA